jgi:RimJ/RimL family protein N-acetyltransferase
VALPCISRFPIARFRGSHLTSNIEHSFVKLIFETERLLIREYVEEDAEAFFKLNSDPEVLRFVPDKALLNVEQAGQLLVDHPIADYRKHGFGRGACTLN